MTAKPHLLLLLGACCALVGCQPPPMISEEDRPAVEARIASTLESDRASLIYAQQEKQLVQRQTELTRAKGAQPDARPAQAAEMHLQVAQYLMQVDQDRARTEQDMTRWFQYAKSPATRY